MPFIDWNSDWEIAPVDIGISIATEIDYTDEEVAPPPEAKKKTGCGCLTATLTFISIAMVTIFIKGQDADSGESRNNLSKS